MNHDYYAVLGVDPMSSQAALQSAFLLRAKQWHPDRGGSHERMKLLNEAWQILSDPQRRREYDAVRGGRADNETKEHFRRSAKTAEECSTQYPAHWADFERWFLSAVNDFSTADYGSWDALEIKNSRSGWAFVKIGMICGGLFGIALFLNTFDSFFVGIRRIVLFGALGALLGKGLHYTIGSALVPEKPESKRQGDSPTQKQSSKHRAGAERSPLSSAATETVSSASAPSEPPAPRFQVISCRSCRRTLRIPDPPPSDVVKCPSCGSRFELRAAR